MIQRITINVGGPVRYETLDGRPHIVAPAAILPDGVITGNRGATLYTKAENDKSVPSWNHRPMVVYHPKDKKGNYVSACNQAILETRKVGITLNSSSDDKLRTEAWFDIEKTKSVDNRIIEALEAGEPIECSTGLYADYKKKDGEYKGEKYKIAAKNYRPDHLAVFVDKKGAYSIEAGGGILQVHEEPERNQHILARTVENKLKEIAAGIVDNEMSFEETTRQLSDLLAAKVGEKGKYWQGYICHVYPDYVVYSDGNSGLWVLDYVSKDDSVTLGKKPEQVERIVEYRTKGGDSYSANEAGILTKGESEVMAGKKFNKKAHIDSLIGNGYEESDREELEKTPEKILQSIKPITVNEEVDEDDDEEEVEVNEKPVKAKKITLKEFLVNGKDEDVEWVKSMKKRHAREKKRLINTIMANQKVFKEDHFKDMDIETLQGTLDMIRNAAKEDDDDDDDRFQASYRGAAGHADIEANEDGDESGGAEGLPLDGE